MIPEWIPLAHNIDEAIRSLRTEDIQYEAISGEVTNGTVKPVWNPKNRQNPPMWS